jgi:hypothetical protein
MLVLSLILSIFFTNLHQDSCGCKKVKHPIDVSSGISKWLGGEFTVRRLEGTVTDGSGELLEDALIEVTTMPKKGTGKIVRTCLTQPGGKFCFKGLKPGKYQVKYRKEGYNAVYATVNITSQAEDGKTISIEMSVGV